MDKNNEGFGLVGIIAGLVVLAAITLIGLFLFTGKNNSHLPNNVQQKAYPGGEYNALWTKFKEDNPPAQDQIDITKVNGKIHYRVSFTKESSPVSLYVDRDEINVLNQGDPAGGKVFISINKVLIAGGDKDTNGLDIVASKPIDSYVPTGTPDNIQPGKYVVTVVITTQNDQRTVINKNTLYSSVEY